MQSLYIPCKNKSIDFEQWLEACRKILLITYGRKEQIDPVEWKRSYEDGMQPVEAVLEEIYA